MSNKFQQKVEDALRFLIEQEMRFNQIAIERRYYQCK